MLNINTAIHSLISGLTDKVYFNVVNENVALPRVVLNRNLNVDYSKDGYSSITNIVTIIIMGVNYTESLTLANSINSILLYYRGIVNGIEIKDVSLDTCDENWSEDCYKQILTYKIIAR